MNNLSRYVQRRVSDTRRTLYFSSGVEQLESRLLLTTVQQVSVDAQSIQVGGNAAFEFDVLYQTIGTVDDELFGIGIRLHFDSTAISFGSLTNVYQDDLFPIGPQRPDTANHDGDPTTDQFVTVGWFDTTQQWPGNDNASLLLFRVAWTSGSKSTNTRISITDSSHDPGAQFQGTSLPVVIDATAPRIEGVRVGAVTWTDMFVTHLDPISRSYTIPNGESQLKPLPWSGLNVLIVKFNERVSGQFTDFTLSGARRGPVGISVLISLDSDGITSVASIAIPSSLTADEYTLTVDHGIQDTLGNRLDGDWMDGQSANLSGDGSPGGDFAIRINVLPGDINQSGTVAVNDLGALRVGLGSEAGETGYDAFTDMDGSGAISVGDVAPVRANLGRSLFLESTLTVESWVAAIPESLNEIALALSDEHVPPLPKAFWVDLATQRNASQRNGFPIANRGANSRV